LHLTESIRFRDGLIVHLEDHYKPETLEEVMAHVLRYGEALGIETTARSSG
jgi:hypothetical protein